MNNDLLLNATGLMKTYHGKTVVKGVSINVKPGEVVGLLGPNGAGKTTSFYMIMGLVKPNKGSIFINGVDASKYPIYKRARLGLGYLPQESSIFKGLSVEDNIKAILEIKYKNKQSRKLDLQHEIEKKGLIPTELIGIFIGYFVSGIQTNFLTIGNRIARGDIRLKDRIDKAVSKAIKKTIQTAEKELKKESEQIIKYMEGEG